MKFKGSVTLAILAGLGLVLAGYHGSGPGAGG